MKKYVFIGIGGALGSALRFFLKNSLTYFMDFPINTFIINIIGCLFISIVLTSAYEFLKMDESLRIGIVTGFIGAFTTFSTVCKELYFLLINNKFLIFTEYLFSTIFVGLLSILIGVFLTRKLFKILYKLRHANPIELKDEELQ